MSLLKRAREAGVLEVNLVDIRDFASGRHAKVDDRPYGGGPGMVLKPEPTCAAIRAVRREGAHVVYLSPQGKLLCPEICQRLAAIPHLVLLCGHYEGVDERVIDREIDEEVSIGDYVLMTGCSAALVVLEAVTRFVPGVVGNAMSVLMDSFQEEIFDAPHYTRPSVFEGSEVPPVLRGGDHKEIEAWRKGKAREKTLRVRPDLVFKEKR